MIEEEVPLAGYRWEHGPVGCLNSHFMDSGSFALWRRTAVRYHKANPKAGHLGFYDTDLFWQFVDGYCDFVKRYQKGIDHFANVDVIPHPELSWRNQQYIEKKGLRPVPVVHFRTDLKWLAHYIKEGHELIGLGGLVGAPGDQARQWLDHCFEMVCNTANGKPCVKLHGFGITNHRTMLRYPWWSVDSTSWLKVAAYGNILMPRKRKGKWDASKPPYVIRTAEDSTAPKEQGGHYLTMSKLERKIVEEWLEFVGVPLGVLQVGSTPGERGVLTRYVDREVVNLRYFEWFRKQMPKFPWAFKKPRQAEFGFWQKPAAKAFQVMEPAPASRMIIYYSGTVGGGTCAEQALADTSRANIMMSYWDVQDDPDLLGNTVYAKRFRCLHLARTLNREVELSEDKNGAV